MMLSVITGASGHVGGNLVRELIARGERPRVLVRTDTRAVEGLDVEGFHGDILDPASLVEVFAGADVVYHLASRISISRGDEDLVWRTNVEGTRNVISACLAAGVKRLVHFSSIHALRQTPLSRPIDENQAYPDEKNALIYDRTKAEGERAIMVACKEGLSAVVVNPTAIIGPHDYKPSAMGEVILRLMRGTFPALVAAGFDWVDVRDVCEGAIAAASSGKSGERYLLAGTYVRLPELASFVGKATGVRPPRFVSPLWLARLGAPFMDAWARARGSRPLFTPDSIRILRESNPAVSCAKARRELGYSPRPIEETIADTCAWFRGAGMCR